MAELPTGTVTFLFTDVEGSTRLLKLLRERYGEVLREHHRLLREAFELHGGHEIDTQGDSFFVAFRRAKDAVAAAVDAQRALAAHPWPEGAELRVRMGIHTGEAAVAGDRYLGVAVHRAARIAAAGHGGQILVSQITHDLLHDEEADLQGVEIRDLGEQRLKDLDRPVRLYQVSAHGLPAEFPPVRTADRVPERGTTPFAGQEDALAEAARGAIVSSAKRRRRSLAAVAAALVVAVAAAVAFAATRGSEPKPLRPVVPGSLLKLDPRSGEVLDVLHGFPGGGEILVTETDVWVNDAEGGLLTRLVLATGEVGRVGIRARGLVPAGERRIWVAADDPARISLVDAASLRTFRSIRLGMPSVELFRRLLARGDGDLWTVVPVPGRTEIGEGAGVVVRIDPETGKVVQRVRVGRTPWEIAYGVSALWVSHYRPDVLTRIDAYDETVTQVPVRHGPLGIVIGQGAVWVAHYWDSLIARVNATSYEIDDVIRLPDPPSDLAVDARVLWATQPAKRTVVRLDPRNGSVLKTVRLAAPPFDLALGAGALWVRTGKPEE